MTKATPEAQNSARAQVSHDARRTNKPRSQVFAQFWCHPSPYLLSAALAASVAGRLIVGGGSWWELVIPAILIAILPLIEWTVHVFVLHWKPRTIAGLHVDPLLSRKHREHHANPRDIPLVFLPWQTHIGLVALFAALAWLVTPTWSAMFTMLVSDYMLLSAYEWTHYLLHSDYRPRSRWYRMVWRNHRLHHYKSEHYWFAVTTAGTADRLLSTYPDPGDVETSPTVKKLHMSTAAER